ncbi:hypothetical protein GGI43DRAFT_322251 [Trichoderma evansii]
MITKKERDYLQTAANQEVRLRQQFIGRVWLGSLPTQMSYTAVDLLAQQHRRAEASIKNQEELPPFHPRWWLDNPLDLNEPLLRIRDPNVIENLRGRPRLPQNHKAPVDIALQPISAPRLAAPSSTAASSSQPFPSLPTSTQRDGRRMTSSLRHTRTATEVETASSQASQPSTKRSRTGTNTRGRGTRRGRATSRSRGGRGRGGSSSTTTQSTPPSSAVVEEVIPATQLTSPRTN